MRQRITQVALTGMDELSQDERDGFVNLVANSGNDIAKAKPENIVRLQRTIELVSLDTMIDRYKSMLAKKLPERTWQRFFEDNPFVLTLAFGYPVVTVRGAGVDWRSAIIGTRR